MLGEFFDPKADFLIEETCRPHWSQAGAVVFVTFRTNDSIPFEVLDLWERQKKDWMARRGFAGGHWSENLNQLNEGDRAQFNKEFNRTREDCLDTCLGECVLKQPRLASIVASSLLHFDKVRYRMGDFIVMPNHVHLLCVFPNEELMRKQFDSWQQFTATRINRLLGQTGKFWQGDPFDHLVRSPEQYEYLRKYIAENPLKAGLREGEFHYRRYPD